jgi:hypothetical protein
MRYKLQPIAVSRGAEMKAPLNRKRLALSAFIVGSLAFPAFLIFERQGPESPAHAMWRGRKEDALRRDFARFGLTSQSFTEELYEVGGKCEKTRSDQRAAEAKRREAYLHRGFDYLPGIDLDSLLPQQPAPDPDQPKNTDPDWSNFPEARTTSKGPDGEAPDAHPWREYWNQALENLTRRSEPSPQMALQPPWRVEPDPSGPDISGNSKNSGASFNDCAVYYKMVEFEQSHERVLPQNDIESFASGLQAASVALSWWLGLTLIAASSLAIGGFFSPAIAIFIVRVFSRWLPSVIHRYLIWLKGPE